MMSHVIINVGRQLGSGGHDIGRMLALDFQAKYYDKEIMNLAAKESGFSEKFFEQNDEKKGFFKGLFNVQTSHFSGGSMYKTNFSQESLFQFQSDAIRKAAKEGSCVFVGRCADYVLRDFKNVVNERLIEEKKEFNDRNSLEARLKQAFLPDVDEPNL